MNGETKLPLPRGLRIDGKNYVAFLTPKDNLGCERRIIGPVAEWRLKDADQQLKAWRQAIKDGNYKRSERSERKHAKPAPKPDTVPEKTVGVLWPLYLRKYENAGGKDSSRLLIAWEHLKPMFEKMRVDDMTTDDVERYVEARRNAGKKNGTINRETSLLRAMFSYGAKVTPPIVTRIVAFPAKLAEAKPRKGFIEDEQYAVLAANCKPLWLRALIACAYSFGFRKGELLNLRAEQVDFLDRMVRLTETKNGEQRTVPMTGETYELLRACCTGKKPDDYVFTRDAGGRHERVCDPRKEWYSLCVTSGLGQWVDSERKSGKKFKAYRGLNLHDFRRSAVSYMVRQGVSETVAMAISGHKTRKVFERYNITNTADLRDAARRIEAGRKILAPVAPAKTDSETDSTRLPVS